MKTLFFLTLLTAPLFAAKPQLYCEKEVSGQKTAFFAYESEGETKAKYTVWGRNGLVSKEISFYCMSDSGTNSETWNHSCADVSLLTNHEKPLKWIWVAIWNSPVAGNKVLMETRIRDIQVESFPFDSFRAQECRLLE